MPCVHPLAYSLKNSHDSVLPCDSGLKKKKKRKKQIKKKCLRAPQQLGGLLLKSKREKKKSKWHLCALRPKGGTNGSYWPHSSNKLRPRRLRRVRTTRDRRERARPVQSLPSTHRCDHRTRRSSPEAAKSWCWSCVRGPPWSSSSVSLHLLHDLHEDGPGPSQDQVAHGPVVVGQHVQSVHRHHELTHLHTEGEGAQVCKI